MGGLFRGIRTCENSSSEGRNLGEKYEDGELYGWQEFTIYDENNKKLNE